LPNGIPVTVEFPDGTVVGDNFNIGAVTPADNGPYLLTSSEGCTTIINLIVEDQGCQPGDVVPEYTIDGVTASGTNPITVDEGQSVILSMLPDGIGLMIILPDGTEVEDDYSLGNIVPSQSGTYTFTSADGCIDTLNISVNGASCELGDLVPEYTIEGVTASGTNPITVDEGQLVVLSMLPDGIGLTITLPDGSQVGDNHDLDNIAPSQSGTYTFTSVEGCVETLDIHVLPADNCQPEQIIPEYELDGVWSSGLNDLSVNEGTTLMFSMLPNGIPVTVEFPDGTVVGDNFNIGAVTPADNGPYLLTSSEGCQTTINLTVASVGRAALNISSPDSKSNEIVYSEVSLVYPNPTEGILNISLNGFESEQLVAMVFSSTGQLVSERLFSNEHGVLEQINLNNLPVGIYRLILQSASRRQVHSVLVRK
jgi:hypothetical protein